MGENYTPELVKHVSTNLKYLLHWENGLELTENSRLEWVSQELNFLELSFYHTGLSENINERQQKFLELFEKAPAANLLTYVIGTGRNRYNHKIPHNYQRPLIHNKSTQPRLWKQILATNPYDKDTLYRRLQLAGEEAHKHVKTLREEYQQIYVPGPEAKLELPTNKSFHKYHTGYNTKSYKTIINEVTNSISKKLQGYLEPRINENQMNNKLVVYQQEHPHKPQLRIRGVKPTRKHPGISHFYEEPQPLTTTKQAKEDHQLNLFTNT